MKQYEISTNKNNTIVITDCIEFNDFIQKINDHPVICYIEHDNDIFITIGVSKNYGFFQYSSKSSNDSSLIATNNSEIPANVEYFEFDCEGTPTPVHYSKCLKMDLVLRIACDYIMSRSLPNYVQWESV